MAKGNCVIDDTSKMLIYWQALSPGCIIRKYTCEASVVIDEITYIMQ